MKRKYAIGTIAFLSGLACAALITHYFPQNYAPTLCYIIAYLIFTLQGHANQEIDERRRMRWMIEEINSFNKNTGEKVYDNVAHAASARRNRDYKSPVAR